MDTPTVMKVIQDAFTDFYQGSTQPALLLCLPIMSGWIPGRGTQTQTLSQWTAAGAFWTECISTGTGVKKSTQFSWITAAKP